MLEISDVFYCFVRAYGPLIGELVQLGSQSFIHVKS